MHNATYLQCANIVVTSFIIAATSVYTAWPIFSDSLHACVHVVLQSVFLNRNNAQIYICRRLFNIPRVGMLKSRRHRFALYVTADSSVSARMGELFSTNTWLIKHFIYTDSRMRRQVVNLSSVGIYSVVSAAYWAGILHRATVHTAYSSFWAEPKDCSLPCNFVSFDNLDHFSTHGRMC